MEPPATSPAPNSELHFEDEESDSDEKILEELLKDRGPLIQTIPNSLEMKQVSGNASVFGCLSSSLSCIVLPCPALLSLHSTTRAAPLRLASSCVSLRSLAPQLENVIRHLHSQIKVNTSAIKRDRNAKKAALKHKQKAAIAADMSKLPGSRPGTPGHGLQAVVKSAATDMAERWAEVSETKGENALEDKVNLLFEMMVKTVKTMESIQDSITHSQAIQAAKDEAQDEVMQMEFDSYDRKLSSVLKYKDLSEAMNLVDAQVKALEANMKRQLLDTARAVNGNVEHELEKVLSQVKGVVDATDGQDKLLDEKVERLVQKQIEMGPSGQHTVSKETVIIKEAQDKQQRQDHTIVNKLKERVNTMELDHAKAMNLLERLSKQCEMASERAMKSEALAETMEEKIMATNISLNETLTGTIEENFKTLNTTIHENKVFTETIITETKNVIREERDEAINVAQAAIKGDIEMVKETVQEETGKLVEASITQEVKQMETRQEAQILKMVGKAEEEEQAEMKEGQKRLESELARLKMEIEGLANSASEAQDSAKGDLESVSEAAKKHTISQMELISKQLDGKHTEITNRVDELKAGEVANKLGIKTIKEDVENLMKMFNGTLEGVKKESRDNNVKLIEQNMQTKLSLGSSIADLEEKLNVTNKQLDDEVQNFSDENFSMQGAIADLSDDLTKLATRSNMWDAIAKKLDHHVKTLGQECANLEESASSSKPTLLSIDLQRYLAGNTQRIAKLIATKADFEVIRKIVNHSDPALVDWDAEVNTLRATFRLELIGLVREEARKKHPITDLLLEEAREKFMAKVSANPAAPIQRPRIAWR